MTTQLIRLRNQINRIDDQILTHLGTRVTLAKQIARAKKTKGLPIRDEQREKEVLGRVASKAEACGLNPKLTKRIFRDIIELAVDAQRTI